MKILASWNFWANQVQGEANICQCFIYPKDRKLWIWTGLSDDAQNLEIQGGCPWGFGPILLRGVLGVIRKSRGSTCFCLFCFLLYFYMNFLDHTPPPPVHLWLISFQSYYMDRSFLMLVGRILANRLQLGQTIIKYFIFHFHEIWTINYIIKNKL
jgi:hypothetical protein